MTSGIYAVATFGEIQLYVGEVKHLKTRWPKMLVKLEQGNFPDEDIQAEWTKCGSDRRFTFHTAGEIQRDPQIRGRKLFLKDIRPAESA